MRHKRKKTFTARTPTQVRALASPARLEILRFLEAVGPCSIAELARAMDRPADGLYRHLRILRRHGMVVDLGQRPAGRRREVILDVAASYYRVDFDPTTGRGARDFHRLIDAVFRETAGAIRSVDRAEGLILSGRRRNFQARNLTGWLTDDDLARVNAALTQIEDIFAAGLRRREGHLYLTTLVLTPIVRSRRGRRSNAQPATSARPPDRA